jgi:hypothetical protein
MSIVLSCSSVIDFVSSIFLSELLKRFWEVQPRNQIIKQTLKKVGSDDLYDALGLGSYLSFCWIKEYLFS